VGAAVSHALRHGYRHIDCASVYGNEHQVGRAFAESLSDASAQQSPSNADTARVDRREVFITTKIFNQCHTPQGVRASVQASLDDLQLAYVDLILMHWPLAYDNEEFKREHVFVRVADFPEKFHPIRLPSGLPNPELRVVVEFKETWRAMAQELGKSARFAGVSNFSVEQLQELLDFCAEEKLPRPVVNQVEFHPLVFKEQARLLEFCREKGISVVAYSPLGSGDSYSGFLNSQVAPNLLQDPVVCGVAATLQKSPGQTLIRWCIQHGVSVIPKSSKPARIEENFDVFSFSISEADMARIDGLSADKTHRFGLGWYPGHFLPETTDK
jgi:diketogulonate reductase-like aldo/keto reductase